MNVSSQPTRHIGFLMDPYDTLNLDTETSLLLMDELMCRGHVAYWIEQPALSLRNGRLEGRLTRVQSTAPFILEASSSIAVDALDALIIRKDPPFDKSYLHLTYLLDYVPADVVQINSPAALRDVNEKVFMLRWPQYCPDTLVSRDLQTVLAFARRHDKVVLKPLDDCSGRRIRFVQPMAGAAAEAEIAAMLDAEGYVVAQAFLPAVRQGDKRVYLVNGEPIAWVNRVPGGGSDLANIHQGATCEAAELTVSERHISELVGNELVARGILLAGLDFIAGKLTEVNVTSPSALRQINEVTGQRVEREVVDGILSRIDRHAGTGTPAVAASIE